jgi:hypothetical protein
VQAAAPQVDLLLAVPLLAAAAEARFPGLFLRSRQTQIAEAPKRHI